MRLGSLCTGYGGLDMAVSAHYGADLAWYSEVDKACNQLLAHHWPGVPNLGDLTTIDWNRVDPVDVLCAGFPCQPFSHAGKREGENDDRAIFAYIADAVSVLRPGIVVLENVPGILTLGGPGVVGTLTGLGYDLRWGLVRASDAGAPHRRARWFCIARSADTAGVGFGERAGFGESKPTGQRRDRPGDSHRTAPTDPDDSRQPLDGANDGTPGERRHEGSCIARGGETPTDTGSVGREPRAGQLTATGRREAPQRATRDAEPGRCDPTTDWRQYDLASPGGEARVNAGHSRKRVRVEPVGHPTLTTDPDGEGPQRAQPEERRNLSTWGRFGAAVTGWERVLDRPAPAPTDDGKLSSRFVEWLMGLSDGHVCALGLSRTAELKALGNGVCPQQAALALTLLDD